MRVGVLRNPLSTKNVGQPRPSIPDGVSMVEIGPDKSIAEAVQDLIGEGLDLLIIDGGDGTITAALTALIAQGVELPPLGFIANGNTNLIARKTGKPITYDSLVAVVTMPLEAVRDKLRPTPALRIDIADQQVRFGFIAGWGAYAWATRMAIEEIGARHDMQIIGAIFSTLRRSLFGAEARAMRDGVACRLEIDGVEAVPDTNRFIGVVTCFEGRLPAGIRPFWGKGNTPIRWLDVISPPRYHVLFAPFVAFGFSLSVFERLGYRSGRAARLSVTLSDMMIIDGEVVSLPPNAKVEIDADKNIDIFHL